MFVRGKGHTLLSRIAYPLAGNFLLALVAVLAGCAVNGHLNRDHVPDWESERFESDVHIPEPPPTPSPAPAPQTNVPPTSPAIQAPPIELRETWVSLSRWCHNHNLAAPRLLSVGPSAAFSVNSTNGVFAFQIGSLVAGWQGVQLRLGFAPQIIDGQPFFHTLDVQKTLLPLVQDNFALPGSNHIIVLDPGHGGENPGTRSVLGRYFEKDFTLDWAHRLVPLLVSNGWTVFLTRTNDTDLALSNRIAFADRRHADLFVSLHFNSSAPDEAQYGLETYCLTPAGMPSTVTRGFSDEIATSFANNAFDAQNLELAWHIHRALLQVNGGRDRGIRRARFPGVLRGNQRPAILIEGGYLSNPGEARRIATASYRQKLAEAVAQALGAPAQMAMRSESP
jgi:N-acetylmuramoyl-L-alanine amidase